MDYGRAPSSSSRGPYVRTGSRVGSGGGGGVQGGGAAAPTPLGSSPPPPPLPPPPPPPGSTGFGNGGGGGSYHNGGGSSSYSGNGGNHYHGNGSGGYGGYSNGSGYSNGGSSSGYSNGGGGGGGGAYHGNGHGGGGGGTAGASYAFASREIRRSASSRSEYDNAKSLKSKKKKRGAGSGGRCGTLCKVASLALLCAVGVLTVKIHWVRNYLGLGGAETSTAPGNPAWLEVATKAQRKYGSKKNDDEGGGRRHRSPNFGMEDNANIDKVLEIDPPPKPRLRGAEEDDEAGADDRVERAARAAMMADVLAKAEIEAVKERAAEAETKAEEAKRKRDAEAEVREENARRREEERKRREDRAAANKRAREEKRKAEGVEVEEEAKKKKEEEEEQKRKKKAEDDMARRAQEGKRKGEESRARVADAKNNARAKKTAAAAERVKKEPEEEEKENGDDKEEAEAAEKKEKTKNGDMADKIKAARAQAAADAERTKKMREERRRREKAEIEAAETKKKTREAQEARIEEQKRKRREKREEEAAAKAAAAKDEDEDEKGAEAAAAAGGKNKDGEDKKKRKEEKEKQDDAGKAKREDDAARRAEERRKKRREQQEEEVAKKKKATGQKTNDGGAAAVDVQPKEKKGDAKVQAKKEEAAAAAAAAAATAATEDAKNKGNANAAAAADGDDPSSSSPSVSDYLLLSPPSDSMPSGSGGYAYLPYRLDDVDVLSSLGTFDGRPGTPLEVYRRATSAGSAGGGAGAGKGGDASAAAAVVVSTWVYLDDSGGKDDGDGDEERTIFTTGSFSPASCDDPNYVSDGRPGMALYVSRHSTTDEKEADRPTLAYRTSDGKCKKLFSTGSRSVLSPGVWTQVAVEFNRDKNGADTVTLYVNGGKAGQKFGGSPRIKPFAGLYSDGNALEKVETGRTFLGRTSQGSKFLNGRVGSLSIWTASSSPSPNNKKNKQAGGGQEGHNIIQAVFRAGFDAPGTESVRVPNNAKGGGAAAGAAASCAAWYGFGGESDGERRSESVSRLKDIAGRGHHGTVRRHVPIHESAENPAVVPFAPPGADRYPAYKSGDRTPPTMSQEEKSESDALARTRRTHVRNALRHAWEGYRSYAWGCDELNPLSGKCEQNWGGLGNTLVDALSTLWVAGLKDEFREGRDWVRDELNYDRGESVGKRAVSVFETTIRNLGGLLGAYDLSGDGAFLTRADELGGRLLKAFDTANGIPYGEAELKEGGEAYNAGWHRKYAVLSELGTMQLEFRYLSKATGKREYQKKVMKVFDLMEKMNPPDGLYPIYVTTDTPSPEFGSKKISMGAMGDSFYEYMLKVWIQGGRKAKSWESKYRRMYDRAMDGVHAKLKKVSNKGGYTFVGEFNGVQVADKMDHLSCFLGGNLALGAYTHPDGMDSPNAQRDLKLGKALAYTCYQMYAHMNSGVAPEYVTFHGDRDFGVAGGNSYYILRPETAETLYLLYTITGDPVYREWGWEIFRAVERHARSDIAFATLPDVSDPNKAKDDKMESFFLAETLKYLYLLQDPDSEIDILNKHVFNTEAHPLRRFDRL